MTRQAAVVVVALALAAGCGAKAPLVTPPPAIVKVLEPVEVKVPIAVKAVPPAELLVPVRPPLPVFVAPADSQASSALTVEGERLLRGLIEELLARLRAWEAWASSAP